MSLISSDLRPLLCIQELFYYFLLALTKTLLFYYPVFCDYHSLTAWDNVSGNYYNTSETEHCNYCEFCLH
jgi:hypothetical protein